MKRSRRKVSVAGRMKIIKYSENSKCTSDLCSTSERKDTGIMVTNASLEDKTRKPPFASQASEARTYNNR